MTITLLPETEYNRLLTIQKMCPKLTFQNNGYEYINRRELNESEKEADKEVHDILKQHIDGFVRFDNFKYNKKNELVVRFQYKYSPSFTGVGYITLRELKDGFDVD